MKWYGTVAPTASLKLFSFYYIFTVVPEAGEGGFTRSEFLDVMRNDLVSIFAPLFPDEEEDAFQALAYFYSPWPHIYSENFNRGMLNNVY